MCQLLRRCLGNRFSLIGVRQQSEQGRDAPVYCGLRQQLRQHRAPREVRIAVELDVDTIPARLLQKVEGAILFVPIACSDSLKVRYLETASARAGPAGSAPRLIPKAVEKPHAPSERQSDSVPVMASISDGSGAR